MYLSLLKLNPRSRAAHHDADSAYDMHSTLARLFTDAPKDVKERRFKELSKDEKERVLFRVESYEENGWVRMRVLVQSYRAPDFSQLPPGYCAEPPQTRGDYEEKLKALAPGQTLRFRLRANPTKRSKDSGQRVGLREEGEQRQWLKCKLRDAGAELMECQFMPHEVTKAYKHKEADGPKQIHLGVLFEGALRVLQPEIFWAAVESGIGSAKGYGFGLLSLAPA